MTDIVERLKRGTEIKKIDAMGNEHTTFEATLMEHEAAAEIERLRAALQEVVCSHDNIEKSAIVAAEAGSTPSTAPHVRFIRSIDEARRALEGKDE